MSSKATILWLCVAVVFGAAALLLLRSSPAGPSGGGLVVGDAVVRFDLTRLAGVRIEHPSGDSEVVQRSGTAEWSMRVLLAGRPAATGEAASEPAWPVPSSRIESLGRLLMDAKARAVPDAKSANMDVGDRPTVVTLEIAGASAIVLRLSERSIAGTAMIEVEDANVMAGADGQSARPRVVRATIDDRLHELFRGGAPREWRDRTAMTGAGLDVSRVRLTNDRADVVAIARLQGAWSVREPFAAPADPAAVQRLLGLLAGVKIADFLDGGAPPDPKRFSPPAASATMEIDRREVGSTAETKPTVTVERHGLEIGGAADARGDRLFARIDGERVVVIDARSVADLRLDATLYVWPFATRIDASEVGTIVLRRNETGVAADGGRVYRRQLETWKRIGGDGQETTLGQGDIQEVVDLLTLLTGGPAGGTSAGEKKGRGPIEASTSAKEPRGFEAMGMVSLLSLAGAPLETIVVGRGLAGRIVLKTGAVYREYPVDRVPAALADLIKVGQATPLGETPKPDINK